ncbi:MAG: nucleotidyltransferase domain-containing protein [Bacteroidota bacterium]
MSKNSIILRELKKLLSRKIGDNISDLIIFGSQLVSGKKENSDYDILIVLKNNYDWKTKEIIRHTCYDISLQFDIVIDSKIISINELYHTPLGMDFLYQEALRTGLRA